MNIALLGCGTVGSGVFDLLQRNETFFKTKFDSQINIKHILVRDIEKRKEHEEFKLFTNDFEVIREDNDIDIVIEVMGGINPAYEYITESLKQKRHVITANKELIAKHGIELMDIARQNDVVLLYEASVAGAIPVIDAIMSGLSGNVISGITGIVNGTTNFILTSMKENKMSFEDSLKLAQELGYAESCPDSDIQGLDSARKLIILSMVAYGEYISMEDITIDGICSISLFDIEYADKLGYEIKLLMICKKEEQGLCAIVAPFLIDKSNQLSSVKDVLNAIIVKCDAADEIMLMGKGAGKYPTASAVLGNVMQLATNRASNIISDNIKTNAKVIQKNSYEYYLRFELTNSSANNKKIACFTNEKIKKYEFIDNNLVVLTEQCSNQVLELLIEEIESGNEIEYVSKIRIL